MTMTGETQSNAVSAEDAIERICAAAAARKGLTVTAGRTARATVLAALRASNPYAAVDAARHYTIADFLVLQDMDFIDAAYRGILRRRADPGGAQHFLTSLRNGALSKTDVLGRLRYSAEGRCLGVPIKGLARAFAIAQIRGVWNGAIRRLMRLRRA
jgi:hypothetical protein